MARRGLKIYPLKVAKMHLVFNGTETHDQLEVTHDKGDRCLLTLTKVDSVEGQMLLVKDILQQLGDQGCSLFGLISKNKFHLPDESLCYQDVTYSRGNLVYCERFHFEEFFRKNLSHLITHQNVFLPPIAQEDEGWTTVSNKKKLHKDKYQCLMTDVQILCADWGTIQ